MQLKSLVGDPGKIPIGSYYSKQTSNLRGVTIHLNVWNLAKIDLKLDI